MYTVVYMIVYTVRYSQDITHWC